MAGLTSIASTAMQALSFVNTVTGGRDSDREYKQLQQRNALELSNMQRKNELEKAELRLSADQAAEERRDALRRAIARQRAQFGASGIDMDSGSAQAVLLGIYDENDEKRAQREALDSLKSNILDNNYANQQRVNTLQLTQLKERNKLKKTGSVLESLTSIF